MEEIKIYPFDEDRFPVVVTTFQGLEGVLGEEIMRLGGEDIAEKSRAVMFTGNKKLLYAANYHLRTALRVLRVVGEFKAANEDELYRSVREIAWDTYFSNHQKFLVEPVVHSPRFRNSMFVAQRVKDAVADHFRDKTGMRPSVDKVNPDIRLNIQISGTKCVISLDSSGESLHKRGYRVRQGVAVLNEVLAAGMVLLTGWRGDTPFIDPMCGSGTLPLEAAMIALDVPPGFMRSRYAFIRWKDYDATLYQTVKSLYGDSRKRLVAPILGSDRSAVAIRLARLNVTHAGFEEHIKLRILPVSELSPPSGASPGVIVTDPPYGKRMRPADIERIYRTTGESLKKNFPGYDAWILSSNRNAFKWIGLKPSASYDLNHGGLHVTYRKFQVRDNKYPGKNTVRQKV
jgi:putative N6-adenine-specific DNA methylase